MIAFAAAVLFASVAVLEAAQQPSRDSRSPQLKVFLDCQGCFQDFLRAEVTFVDYVRDRTEAEVHALITSVETGAGGREHTLALIGAGPFDGVNHTLRTVTTQADPEDVVRRQLATALRIGLTRFGRTPETRPAHEFSVTYEQRERWGSLEARTEWSQYLHDLRKSRLEADGEVSVRVARGLSVAGEVSASRIRDQLSLPARGATPEEVLLRLRQLESGYQYRSSLSLTYAFGSIFSSLVNPRFGQ